MYGPVATSCCEYVEGFPASYFFAYSGGTGALTGSDSAPTKYCFATGWSSWKTIV